MMLLDEAFNTKTMISKVSLMNSFTTGEHQLLVIRAGAVDLHLNSRGIYNTLQLGNYLHSTDEIKLIIRAINHQKIIIDNNKGDPKMVHLHSNLSMASSKVSSC